MTLRLDDSIVALASAPGAAVRGIVRLSGSDVREIVARHFTPLDSARWQNARQAQRHPGEWNLRAEVSWSDAPFRDGLRVPLDVALWPDTRSYTGQPLVELHLVGSPPLLEAIIGQLCRSGCRAARPGEFTLRAFLAGRLDLMQAEAVLGVIDASDHAELELALQQLAGGISQRITTLRSDLLDLLAELEAGLDFVDEDIEFVTREQLLSRVATASRSLDELCQQADRRMATATRPKVVLAGQPNAGKSTLFNALVATEAALVSDVRGTTRDYLCLPLNCDGLSIELIDTAGWDNAVSGIDAVAQQRRDEQLQQADLIVWCSDLAVSDDERAADETLWQALRSNFHSMIRVATKLDARQDHSERPFDALISTQLGRGLDSLRRTIRETLSRETRGQRQWLGMTAARCQHSLFAAREALQRTTDAVAHNLDDDLICIELRDALEQLGQIVGAVYTDDILDRIFSKFCIGK